MTANHTASPDSIPSGVALPMSRREMADLGWAELDVLLVSGDAYVDHPAYGVAVLGRWLVHHGLRVGIVSQPRVGKPEDVKCMGRPRLFAGVTAGALDSMLAHYTAFRKGRSEDANTPGGQRGARPNRATIAYTGLVKRAFRGLPVVIGGIEASLRRASHYDFWSDRLRRSILLNSKADLLVFGMGEQSILEIAQRLARASSDDAARPDLLWGIRGTAFALKGRVSIEDLSFMLGAEVVTLPCHEAILEEPPRLMEATLALERQVHGGNAWALQLSGKRQLVYAPPSKALSTEELDQLYDLPFTRAAHPSYDLPVPGAAMIQFSVTSHRGCGGGCSFCSLALHQGRAIRSRSAASLRREVEAIAQHPDWKGHLSDVGGPSANMWGAQCSRKKGACKRSSCLTPDLCRHFKTQQPKLVRLLKELEALPGVKSLRVSSGVRHDLALTSPGYMRALISDFTGGQLKVAPEHFCPRVLALMRKSSFEDFEQFLTVFEDVSRKAGKNQFVIPYLMSAFPGCTEGDMRALSDWLKAKGWSPKQVQCFVPTPGTVATAMFYAGVDHKGCPIPVARTDAERLKQHRILIPASPPPKKKVARDGKSPKRPGKRRR